MSINNETDDYESSVPDLWEEMTRQSENSSYIDEEDDLSSETDQEDESEMGFLI